MRNELQIQFTGLTLEPLAPWLAESGVIMLPPGVHVWLAKVAQAVDQTGECVGHGGDGCGRTESCPEASIGGPQRTLAMQQMLRSQAQGVRRAVDHVARAACEHVAPTDPVVRPSAEPRGEVLLGLPPAHVQADLRHEGWGGAHLDAVEAGHVDAAAAVECGAHIDVRLVASGVLGPTRGGGRGVGVALDLAVQGVEVGCEAGVARGDVLLVYVVACQGRAPSEEALVAPGAFQTFGDGVGGGFDARVFAGRERGGVACAGPPCADHGHARHTAHVTDDVGQLDVHVGQGLWPVLAAGGRGPKKGVARAQGGPSPTARSGRTEGAVEQPEGVEWLQPLAVGAVGCAAGPVFRVTGVDQVDLQAPRCQDWAQGDPGHPGAGPHHRLNAAGVKPVGQGMEVGRQTGKPAHGLWRAIRRHGDIRFGAAHVNPSGMEVQGR